MRKWKHVGMLEQWKGGTVEQWNASSIAPGLPDVR